MAETTTKGRGKRPSKTKKPKITPKPQKRKAPSAAAEEAEEEEEEEEDYGPQYVTNEVTPIFPLYRAMYVTRSLYSARNAHDSTSKSTYHARNKQ